MPTSYGLPLPEVERRDWLVLISAFFDESGKFKDHSTVSFCGVAATQRDALRDFDPAWEKQLRRCGLKVLTAKEALNAGKPLSKRKPAKGITMRVDVLMPFVECIRKHLELVICTAVDVPSFSAMSSEARRILGNNPHYLAFTRVLMEILEPIHLEDKLSMICDDEEATALPMYRLYRKVKLAYPDARSRLCSISFADDETFYGLQAADLVSSLARLEARKRFHGEQYHYESLFAALGNPVSADRLWGFNTCFCTKEQMLKLSRDYAALKKKYPGVDLRLVDLPDIRPVAP